MAWFVVVLAVVVGGGLFALSVRASQRAMHPGVARYDWNLSTFPDLPAQPVSFPSTTGITLAGRFFPGQMPATIVLAHGYGGNQDEMLPLADALHRAGFSVFTFDQRGCGQSGGAITFGALEQRDLASAVDYLTSRPDVDPARIGALGFSMGGATTLMHAAHDQRIKAVIADSAWADVDHWLRPSLSATLLHPNAPFSSLSLKLVELRAGIDLDKLKPSDVIAAISPRPILLIHGMADAIVPPSDSQLNFAAANEPKELWLISGAAHGDTMSTGNTSYSSRVILFFQHALGS